MRLHYVRSVNAEPGYRLRLTFDDQRTGVVSLEPSIRQGGVFAALSDPIVFGQVSIGGKGRYLEWPTGLDLCADALWMEATGQMPAGETSSQGDERNMKVLYVGDEAAPKPTRHHGDFQHNSKKLPTPRNWR